MDLSFFTAQTLQSGDKAGKNALFGNQIVGANNNANLTNKIDFLNAILTTINEGTEDVKTDSQEAGSETTPEQLKSEKVDLALLQLALLGQDPDQTLEQKIAELKIENLQNTKENRVDQLTKLIGHLTSGLPEQGAEGGNLEDLVNRLEQRLEKLEASLESFRSGDFGTEGAPFQILIATGFNPAQLTNVTNKIEELENKLGRKLTVEDLIAGVGNIIPLPGSDDAEDFSTTDYLGLILENSQEGKNSLNDSLKELAQSSHNSLNTNNTTARNQSANATQNLDNNTTNKSIINNDSASTNNTLDPLLALTAAGINASLAQTTPQTTNSGDGSAPAKTYTPISNIAQQLTNSEFNALHGNSAKVAAKANSSIANIAERLSIPSLPALSDINLPANFSEVLSSQSTISDALGFDINTGTPFSPTVQAAHASTSIPQAGQSHPATQTVSAQLSKSAQAGDTRQITLQLDPAELGRVEVRLEFGQEKSVKAHLIVERPETLQLLQRDALALERALQNAGLETDSGALNYEMASDDYAFGAGQDNNNNNGTSNKSGTEIADGEEEILIETTMTWDVDPETGHVHYNLLA